ncbi:hypothetical protein CDD83_10557 [Cordyceps sp. RAO-2017]|nr:hypothetical protein CDD83_10557 [Cordyceps sp. RAO-2017]
MPKGVEGLPAPASGLTVRHVAVGRGTQNYTCESSGGDAKPKSAGAVAKLFNATCLAVQSPDALEQIPGEAVSLDIIGTERQGPGMLALSGVHYFSDSSTAVFDLDTSTLDIGKAPCAKNSSSSVDAPPTAAKGQLNEPAVPWLRLLTTDEATGGIKEVYRVATAGGSPPATCEGMPAAFEVQYAAVYWFWQQADISGRTEGADEDSEAGGEGNNEGPGEGGAKGSEASSALW